MPFKVDVCARGRLARGGVRRQMRTVKVLKKPPELTFTDTHRGIFISNKAVASDRKERCV